MMPRLIPLQQRPPLGILRPGQMIPAGRPKLPQEPSGPAWPESFYLDFVAHSNSRSDPHVFSIADAYEVVAGQKLHMLVFSSSDPTVTAVGHGTSSEIGPTGTGPSTTLYRFDDYDSEDVNFTIDYPGLPNYAAVRGWRTVNAAYVTGSLKQAVSLSTNTIGAQIAGVTIPPRGLLLAGSHKFQTMTADPSAGITLTPEPGYDDTWTATSEAGWTGNLNFTTAIIANNKAGFCASFSEVTA